MKSLTAESLLAELGWVRALARSLVRDSATAEDLVQDACLAILSSAPESVQKPRGFLRAMLLNLARARARSEIARRDREPASFRPSETTSPDEIAQRVERQRELAEAVLALDEPFRRTIVLRYLDGLEPSEIARREGIPAGTVRRRLKTALERLRERLDHRFEGGRAGWAVAFLPLLDLKSAWTVEVLASKSALVAGTLAMKKSLIAACVLIVGAALVAVSVWPEESSAQIESSATTADAPPASSPPMDAGSMLADPRDAAARSSTGVAAQPFGSRIAGRVRAPQGCTHDGALEVLALDRPLEYSVLARWLDESDPELDAALVTRAPVASSGEFSIDVAGARARVVHLAARGRTQYTSEMRAVALDAPAEAIELVLTAGASLRVELSAAAGAGVAGTRLRIAGSAADMTPAAGILGRGHARNVRAGTDGSFEFRALPLDHAYHVIALPDALAAQKSELEGLTGCTARALRLTLATGATVRGRVVGPDARPVSGADVEALLPGRWLGLDDRSVRVARSDAEGRFELTAVPIGAVNLIARKNGRLESEKLELRPADGATVEGVELVLGTGESIRGRAILADGKPAAGAEISAEFDVAYLANETAIHARRGASGTATADADGRFEIAGLGKGPFTVRAALALGDGTQARARRDGVRPQDSGGELVLHAPAALRGAVVDARGAPLRVFDVEAVRVVDGALGRTGLTRIRKSFDHANGEFALAELEPGAWIVDAIATGLVCRSAQRVEMPSAAPITLMLEPAATLAGRVLGPDGRAFAGAIVQLVGDSGEALGELTPGPVPPSARSESHGRFRLTGVRAGAHRIVASPSNARTALESLPFEVVVASGETRAEIELRLRSGGRLTGEVYDDRGRPAPGDMVHLTHESGATRFGPAGDNGRFAFEHLEPGSWTVVAMDMSAAGSRPPGTGDMDAVYSTLRMTTAELVEGESAHVVLGLADGAPVQVTGTITQGGRPRAGGWISFFPSAGGDVQRFKLAAVDKDGRYDVTLAGGGAYTVSVQQIPDDDDSTIDYQRDIPTVASHRLDFALPSARMGGRVLDPRGKPAAGARVTLFSDGASHAGEYSQGHYAELVTDDRGRFDVPALRGGKYSLQVGGPSDGECFARVVLEEIVLAEDATRDDLVVRLPEPGAISVRVRDADGEPVEGVAIFVRDAQGTCIDPLSAAATDGRGRGQYECIAPGTYTVQVRGGRLASVESAPVRVTAGGEATLELQAIAATQLLVELFDETGRPVHGWVSVFDASNHEVGGQYAADEVEALYFAGAFSPCAPVLGPLAPGRYRVEATAPGGLQATRELELAGEPNAAVALTLSR